MKFQKFKKSYDESIESIEHILNPSADEKSLADLALWLLETDCNPYGFLSEQWAGCLSTAEGFDSLLQHLHHALYDDGDVTFVTVDGRPRIVFYHIFDDGFRERVLTKQELGLEKTFKKYEIEVLDIDASEFGPLYDKHHIAWLKQCFLGDSRHDVESTANHYRKYKQWDESWIAEAHLQQGKKDE